MSNEVVPAVYKWVIDDVVEKISAEFAMLGIDESILTELQQSWEQKVIASKVASFPDPSLYSGQQEHNDHHRDPSGSQSHPRNASQHSMPDLAGYYHLNQTDGPSEFELELTSLSKEQAASLKKTFAKQTRSKMISTTVKQHDGADDDEDDDDDLDDDDEANIGSDLDDEDSEEDVEADHIILCQYDKVSRIKNKWKAIFRDGVVSINDKDYLFNKATGDFEW